MTSADEGRPSLIEALRDPAFYPHRPERVELVETHISWLFLAGELVYKVRKPVVFPFLDYGTPERRAQMCEEEVRLGRRLAPGLYLGVRSIVWRHGWYALGDPGDQYAVEHAVELRRFAEERTLEGLIERGEAQPEDIRAIARRLAAFHAEAEPAPPESFRPSAVMAEADENFETLLGLVSERDAPLLRAGHRFAVAYVHGRRAAMEERAASAAGPRRVRPAWRMPSPSSPTSPS